MDPLKVEHVSLTAFLSPKWPGEDDLFHSHFSTSKVLLTVMVQTACSCLAFGLVLMMYLPTIVTRPETRTMARASQVSPSSGIKAGEINPLSTFKTPPDRCRLPTHSFQAHNVTRIWRL